MRPTLYIAVALIGACILAPTASAHYIAKPRGEGLEARLHSQERNLAHAAYVCERGGGRHRWWSCHAERWLARELAETQSRLAARMSPQAAICSVFGAACQKALSVARCESGFSIHARNGQYLGLFQMGSYARARYGHPMSAIGQARAAYRYFLDAGWGPWACA